MFSRLFGEKRTTIGAGRDGPKPTRDQADTLAALEKLQAAADAMLKKKEFYEKRADNEVAKAKDCLRKNNKSGASLALRRKKMILAKVDGLETSYFQLQDQILELESVQTTTEVFAAMKQAASAQKKVLAKHNPDKVEKVMDDLHDNRDTMRDIQDAMGEYQGAEIDEQELEDELAALEAEEMEGELLEKPRVGAGVRVGPSGVDRDVEKELGELEALSAGLAARPAVGKEKNTDAEVEDLFKELAV